MYKADLWRLCKLYINGGVYADVDLVPYIDINTLDKSISFYSCLSFTNNSVFQAFMINTTGPKNPLILHFLCSFLLNNPYKYKNGPTYDMFNCIKYNLNNIDVAAEKKYTFEEIKIHVEIGESEEKSKIINLFYFPTDVSYTIKLLPNMYNDKFNFDIRDNKLIVTRLDADTGWGYSHSCDICIQSSESVFLFSEKLGENNMWQTSYITYKNNKILDSRDMVYYNNGGW